MARRRSLLPREHGAYAQLAAPLVAALVVREPVLPALLLAVAAIAGFLANEPLLVVRGHRGPRMLETMGERARQLLTALVAVAVACGVTGLALASTETLRAAAIAAVPAVALVALAWRRAQHSLLGELLAAVALPAASIPVAVASGLTTVTAVVLALAWSLGYAASVVAVHRMIARHRRDATPVDHALAAGYAIGLAVLVAFALAERVLWVPLPLAALAAVVVARPPGAQHLRAIGVALVGASVLSIVLAVTSV